MKTLLTLTLAATLAGCASVVYVKEGADHAKMEQDQRECEYEASKATAGIMNGMEAGWAKGELEIKCMRIRGYKLTRQPR